MKETSTDNPCFDVWGSKCPKLVFCPKLSDRRTRSTSADFEPAALLSSSRHLILSRLVPDLPPSPPCMLSLQLPPPTTTNRVAKKWFCRFLFQYNFSSVQRRGFFLRRSTACYCWTPQTAHCCGRGGGSGRLLTNSWRRRRFGLFSTQHSSRTHLAHPLLLSQKNQVNMSSTLSVSSWHDCQYCQFEWISVRADKPSMHEPNVLDLSKINSTLLSANYSAHILSNSHELVLKRQRCTYVKKGVLLLSKTILILMEAFPKTAFSFISWRRIALIQANIHFPCLKF